MEEKRKNYPLSLEEIHQDRSWKVTKSNSLIQKTRFNMDLMQQKIILHLISKIKPADGKLQDTYRFNYYDFCRLCGKPRPKGGKDFAEFKESLLELRRTASEVIYTDRKGHERVTSIGWVTWYDFDTKSGEVQVQLDRNLEPFLLQLNSFYTAYPLLFILPMKSKYSVRLYELIKSYSNYDSFTMDLNELRRLLQNKYIFDEEKNVTRELKDSEIKLEYAQFSDFNRFVLKKATEEINKNTDIHVEYTVNKVKRVPVSITFTYYEKDKRDIDAKIQELNEFLDNASGDDVASSKRAAKAQTGEKRAEIGHTTPLEYSDGASKPVLKEKLLQRLGVKFTEGYSTAKLEMMDKVISCYCTLGNRHRKTDRRIDGGNVFYIDLLNDVIAGNHFRELVDYQVMKYTSELMERVFSQVMDREKYLKSCIENDLKGWEAFIGDMKVKEVMYTEPETISPEDDLLINTMYDVPDPDNM